MFMSRNIRSTNAQKRRILFKDNLIMRVINLNLKLHNFNFFLFALQGGFLNTKVIAYFFTYCKKLLLTLDKTTKVWLNLPSSHIITKKALNVRMGKGKGARLGINAKINAGARIIAIANIRFGLWSKVYRFIRAHCAFAVLPYKKISELHRTQVTTHNNNSLKLPSIAVNLLSVKAAKVTVKRHIIFQIFELYATLQRVKKIKLFIYFNRIFKIFSPKLYLYTKYKLLYFQFWGLFSTWIFKARLSRYYYFLTKCSQYYIYIGHKQGKIPQKPNI